MKIGLRPLYDAALRQAKKPYAAGLMFIIALIEPCLLPLPPDALMIPMAIARRKRAFKFAAICTAGSIIGSIIGYSIGVMAFATIGQWLIDTYNLKDAFDHFHQGFQKWGVLVIMIKGAVPVIPVPFFLVTIASGVVHFDLLWFIFAVAVARGARFFIEALLLYLFGEPIRHFIENYLPWVAGAIVFGVALWFYFVL